MSMSTTTVFQSKIHFFTFNSYIAPTLPNLTHSYNLQVCEKKITECSMRPSLVFETEMYWNVKCVSYCSNNERPLEGITFAKPAWFSEGYISAAMYYRYIKVTHTHTHTHTHIYIYRPIYILVLSTILAGIVQSVYRLATSWTVQE